MADKGLKVTRKQKKKPVIKLASKQEIKEEVKPVVEEIKAKTPKAESRKVKEVAKPVEQAEPKEAEVGLETLEETSNVDLKLMDLTNELIERKFEENLMYKVCKNPYITGLIVLAIAIAVGTPFLF